jgi:hypothetical protein
MEDQAEARAQALADSGYQPVESASLTLAFQQWAVAGEPMPVSLAFPGSGSHLPLIVYLPGLGETAQAGSRWRQAWARAGYAVLSAQPLEFDATAWSSDLARSADFKALARSHQRPELMAERLRHVQALLEEARQRGQAGDSLWSRVDFDNIAFAAYDLGSLAASAVPGARATLLLSPLPMDAATAAGITRPLLMIGSQRDDDLTGLIGSPRQRVQAFPGLPAGNKALLMLAGASHGLLSGDVGQESSEQSGEPATRARSQPGGLGGGRRSHGMGSGGKADDGPPASGTRGAPGREQAQAIETVSIAFLDAQMRGSAQARQWLDRDAAPWLNRLADWQQR